MLAPFDDAKIHTLEFTSSESEPGLNTVNATQIIIVGIINGEYLFILSLDVWGERYGEISVS